MIEIVELSNTNHTVDVMQMTFEFHKEVNSAIPIDPDVVKHNASTLYNNFDRTDRNCWVAYKDNKPAGFLVGYISQFFFSLHKSATQELWFTKKQFRHTRVPLRLLKAFEEWSRIRGASQIYTGVVNTDPGVVKRFEGLMPKIGYSQVGTYFRKETSNA